MPARGCVEIEFEHVPDGAAGPSDGVALGIVLELAGQAANTAIPGVALRALRYRTPLISGQPRRYQAIADPASGIVEVRSSGQGESDSTVHLTATMDDPDEDGSRRQREISSRPAGAGTDIARSRILHDLNSAGVLVGSAGDHIRRVAQYADGIEAEVRLTDDTWRSYRLHPVAVDCAWLLAQFWAHRNGDRGLIHAVADLFRVFQPGAPVVCVRLVEVPPGSATGLLRSLRLTFETEQGVAAVIDGLRSAGHSIPDVAGNPPEHALLSSAFRGELAERMNRTDARERRTTCEQFIIGLLCSALGRKDVDLATDVPFRDLGLTSIKAAGVAEALSVAIDRHLPPTLFFDHPTISALAETLAAAEPSASRPAPRRPRRGAAEEPIAVIGIGCRFPGDSHGPDDYWKLLRDRVDAVGPVPRSRVQLVNGLAGMRHATAMLENIELFDARFFGIGDHEATAMDPQHRILLEVTWEALEHAGIVPTTLANSQTSVFVGASVYGYTALLGDVDAYSALGNEPSAAAGRLSYFLGLRGPSMCVDTACSSSLVAVCLGSDSLRKGESDLAIVGGVNLILDSRVSDCLAAAGVLSTVGRCRAFDRAADGYVRGEGCGVVVLRRLGDALELGERVMAVIPAYAVGHGGRGNGLAAPNKEAQKELMQSVLERGRVNAAEVAYVEAHGAGTAVGDMIELQALAETYAIGSGRQHALRVGSAKTNIGHLELGAGIAGLIKAILAVERAEIPGNLHFETPCETFDWTTGCLQVPVVHQAWPATTGRRLAAVNSFGMSGTYAHVLVESVGAEGARQVQAARGPYLLTVSGRTERSVRTLARAYAHFLQTASPEDLVLTAGEHRQHMERRAAVVGATSTELAARLRDLAAGVTPVEVVAQGGPQIAFLYSGHGCQYAGMGRGLYQREAVFRSAIVECDRLASATLGWSLISLLYDNHGDAKALDSATFTQPAIFAIEYALTRLWKSWGVEPAYVLGHSLGEYAAAQLAGVFDLADAFRLVAARGRLMDSLPANGAMAAVNAPLWEVETMIRSHLGRVAIAAINAPNQVVVSGERAAVGLVCAEIEARGIQTHRLSVPQAAHSPFVEPILDAFEAVAAQAQYSPPNRMLVSSVTGAPPGEDGCSARYWRDQLRRPVSFAGGMETLRSKGVDVFVEIGPRPVLLGPAASCVEGDCRWLPSLRETSDDVEQMLQSAAELYQSGIELEWRALPGARDGRRVSIPTYPFQRRRYWVQGSTTSPDRNATLPEGSSSLDDEERRSRQPAAASAFSQRIQRLPLKERLAEMRSRLKTELRPLLGSDYDDAELERSFNALGLDSLGAVQLRNRIQRLLGCVVVCTVVPDFPNVDLLARHMLDLLGLGSSQGHAPL